MSRNPPQRRKARARNGVAPYSPAAVDFRRGAGSAGHGATEAAHPDKDAASLPLTLRQWDGSPSGRRRFTGSVYDSPGSRQGSRPQTWPVNPSDSRQM
ncbi:TPA: hypothetical protein I8P22_003559 [Salmonella enterica subsp. enterica serovar Napoli]|nr:hypothetical protein [Salmonella enterica subsp. enterica serovar Napoli]